MAHDGRVVKLRFTVPDDMSDDQAHEAAEQIVTDMASDYDLGYFDGTELEDES